MLATVRYFSLAGLCASILTAAPLVTIDSGAIEGLNFDGQDSVCLGAERRLQVEASTPVLADGFGTARRVANAGPQFPTLVGAGRDQFIAAGESR